MSDSRAFLQQGLKKFLDAESRFVAQRKYGRFIYKIAWAVEILALAIVGAAGRVK